jgi:uncharacterized protein (DUF2147 family)
MKTIGLAAILAVTSTAAFAGSFQFSVGGHNARIDFDENCTDRLCASVSWQKYGSSKRTRFRLPEVSTKTISKYIDVPKPHWNEPIDDGEEMAEPSSSEPVSKPSRKAASRAPEADDNTAGTPPAGTFESSPKLLRPSGRLAPRAAAAAESVPAREPAPAGAPGPVIRPAAAPASDESVTNKTTRPGATPSGETAARDGTKVANVVPKEGTAASSKPARRRTPVGEWLVEDGEGKIRIEPCGNNLCGFVSAAKNPKAKDRHNPNPALRNRPVLGTPILINMKPNGRRWSGRIYNVKDGRSYTAHIALKSANTLRVEGCAFGGLICGGQNWSRVN